MSGTYAGESVAKKIARCMLYVDVARVWGHVGKPLGTAITLAGPQACEVRTFRDFLGYSPDEVLFVDRDSSCIDAVKSAWPGAKTFCGDLEEAIRSTPRVGLAHLDFMGNYTASVDRCLEALSRRLVPKGVVAYTFLRGRETERLIKWREARALVESDTDFCLCEDKSCRTDTIRMEGYTKLMVNALSRSKLGYDQPYAGLFPITSLRYDSGRSPMGVLSLVYMPERLRGPRWDRFYEKLCTIRLAVPERIPADSETMLRLCAVGLRKSMGLPAEASAALLNVEESSLPSWLAHYERGTYGHKDGYTFSIPWSKARKTKAARR